MAKKICAKLEAREGENVDHAVKFPRPHFGFPRLQSVPKTTLKYALLGQVQNECWEGWMLGNSLPIAAFQRAIFKDVICGEALK